MTGLQTVSCRIAGMGSDIVLIEEVSVFDSPIDRQDMRVSDFIHLALVCNCAPNYNRVGKVKYAK